MRHPAPLNEQNSRHFCRQHYQINFFGWNLLHLNAVECPCNAAEYNMILATSLQWLRQNIHQKFSPHKTTPLQWRHNGHAGVSNHQPHHCLFIRLFGSRSKKTSKLRVTGLCVGNSPGTGEFPAQMVSNAENVSIWWRRHATSRPSRRGMPDELWGVFCEDFGKIDSDTTTPHCVNSTDGCSRGASDNKSTLVQVIVYRPLNHNEVTAVPLNLFYKTCIRGFFSSYHKTEVTACAMQEVEILPRGRQGSVYFAYHGCCWFCSSGILRFH